MAEELSVVLNRKDNSGFGFSLLGKPGLPPIIYDILEDSPAAESGEVEVGDVILKVNETDVNKFSTKEVLKCLRLSTDPVTLKIKRDPKFKATVKKNLLSTSSGDLELSVSHNNTTGHTQTVYSHSRPEPAVHQINIKTNGTHPEEEALLADHFQENERLQWEPLSSDLYKPKGAPKFEAYMMTGEHILNISRTQQINILPKQQKKLESLRHRNSNFHSKHHHSHHQQQQQHNSLPNSPNEMEMGLRTHKLNSNSTNTSPICANKRDSNSSISESNKPLAFNSNNFVRTSRSEDQLQMQKDSSMNAIDIDIDDDVTSSLNTLLDTRPDVGSNSSSSNNVCSSTKTDRIVWTYNAPVTTSFEQHKTCCNTLSNGSNSSRSNSSPSSPSPLRSRSGSPASPTSVSSSVMSSHSGSYRLPYTITSGSPHIDNGHYHKTNGEYSISEAISNISSPDYNDDNSIGIRDCVMEISDHSDSDSTLLVSEPRQKHGNSVDGDHRIVIQVKGADKDIIGLKDRGKFYRDSELCLRFKSDYLEQESGSSRDDMTEDGNTLKETKRSSSSPPSSEDDSDIESLHSFHYSPKAVDIPSAIRLAKRLYCLDGFKKSDVSRHLSKNNEFSRAVADEYLKYFEFNKDTLDLALRKFLKQFSLAGETQERERVLVHFSKRYLDCNPGTFNSQDAVHTLTCAIMLLNTDLHGQNITRKMSCNEFIDNLAGLNECENFPREILKQLYHAIKSHPLEWALDEEMDGGQMQGKVLDSSILSGNPFLDIPNSTNTVEYKKGYVMRKCCYDSNAKRTPFHKRNWKMFYCTLRDLILYLHKDENGFKKNQMGDNFHNAIRIHHALATKAADYIKKQYVFRLQTSDQAEYLFQTSDSKELQAWIDTINFVCASLSAQPLEAAIGSQKKFQRPLLPCSRTKLNMRDQLRDHEERVTRLESELSDHHKFPPEKNSKSLVTQNYKEKENYLNYELKRYKTYTYILRSHLSQYPDMEVRLTENSIGEIDEASGIALLEGPSNRNMAPLVSDVRCSPPTTNRCCCCVHATNRNSSDWDTYTYLPATTK